MILNKINRNSKTKGFTIVELLVVIVVIGILAAITIVSYTGITQKANTTKALSNAESVTKVADIFFAENSYYPAATSTTAMTSADWTSRPTTAKVPGGITVAPGSLALTASNGDDTVTVSCLTTCTTTTGVRIGYFDFSSSTTLYLYVGAATSAGVFVNPAS